MSKKSGNKNNYRLESIIFYHIMLYLEMTLHLKSTSAGLYDT